jgi:DNA-binding response OmpR family regulator
MTEILPAGRLDGLRVLLVEDEFLVSLALEDDLRIAGATLVGPFNDLISALGAAQVEMFDVAVLDVNLGNAMVYPLAQDLIERDVPFVFLSGYSAADMPARFAHIPRIAKPADIGRLVAAIRSVLKRG